MRKLTQGWPTYSIRGCEFLSLLQDPIIYHRADKNPAKFILASKKETAHHIILNFALQLPDCRRTQRVYGKIINVKNVENFSKKCFTEDFYFLILLYINCLAITPAALYKGQIAVQGTDPQRLDG